MPPRGTPQEWLAIAREAFDTYVEGLERYGVSVDPELRLEAGPGSEIYYQPEKMRIWVGLPDPSKPGGRLCWAFMARLMGVDSIDEAIANEAEQLPLFVTHEVTHHLRHRYGAPIENDFVEEQVVNAVALSFISEQSRYSHLIPRLRELAASATPKLAKMTPKAASARAGFRLDLADVLLEEGRLSRAQLESLRRLADELEVPLDEVVDRAEAASDAELAEASHAQKEAEAYFNRNYMADPTEYESFHSEWFRAYLAHAELPTFAQALERYVLSPDWERSRAQERREFLIGALRDRDDVVAATAAEVLVEEFGDDGVTAVRRTVDGSADRPALRATAAALLGDRDTLAILLDDPRDRSAALGALQRAGADRSLAPQLVRAAVDGPAAERAAALRLIAALPPGTVELAWPTGDEHHELRAAAVACLARHGAPDALAEAVRALDDPASSVREAARDGLRRRGPDAGRVLKSCEGGLTARVEAALLLHDLGEDGPAGELLTALARALDLLDRATGLLAPEEILAVAVGEERAKLRSLALRLAGALGDRSAAELALLALESADPSVRAGAEELARSAASKEARPLVERLFAEVPRGGGADSAEGAAILSGYPDPWLRDFAAAVLTTAEKLVFLRTAPLFRTVPIEALRALSEDFVTERYEPGELIFDNGQEDHRLYVVSAGRVAIDQEGGIRVAELGPGQSFGESGLLTAEPRSARATAAQPTTVLAIGREPFMKLAAREPRVLVEGMAALGRLLREANADLG